MTRTVLRLTASALLLAGLAGAASAQQPVPATRVPAGEKYPAAYRAKDVLGTKVYIAGDVAIGTVDDIVFDDAGNLEYLLVVNEGKLVTVPWVAAKFNFEKKMATLTMTEEQYKVIPRYTVKEYPSYYAPAYRTEVYKTYNLTPRELRRVETGRPVR